MAAPQLDVAAFLIRQKLANRSELKIFILPVPEFEIPL